MLLLHSVEAHPLRRIAPLIGRYITSAKQKFSQTSNSKKLLVSVIGLGTTAAAGYSIIEPLLYAQRMKNPDYTVNLLWLNRRLNENQQYIHPASTEVELDAQLLNPVIEWARATSDGTVIFWYDSTLTPQKAVTSTHKLLKKKTDRKTSRKIAFKDIRTLRYVQDNSEVFSEKLPVYFRVDLCKIIAIVETLEKGVAPYCVFSDLDIKKPLTKAELFDKTTMNNLNRYHIVMKEQGDSSFENQFYIVKAGNQNLIEALKHTLIELNIQRGRFFVNHPADRHDAIKLPEAVYQSHTAMFKYFYHLEGYGTLKNRHTGRMYNKEKDGLEPFGMPLTDSHFLAFNPYDKNSPIQSPCSNLKKEWGVSVQIPTKEVDFPPPSCKYS